MEKLCLLLAFNILWIVPSPGARLEAAPRVARWITVEITGTLGHDNDPSLPIEEYDHWTGYSIKADGKWYAVEFSDKDHEGKAKDLVGKRVHITGTLADRKMGGLIPHSIKLITGTDLKPAEMDSVIETVHLEVEGDLEMINLMGPPPGEGWMVKTGEQTFHLQFSPDLPKEKPAQLIGKKVVVTGTRVDDLTILVAGLRLAVDR
jgi:hypothetical protein